MTEPNTSKNDNADKTASGGCASMVSNKVKETKVKLSHKLAVFAGAVIALSWFFEGCRKIQEGISIEHIAILIFGTASTVFFVGVYAYWIYLEEKLKGTLKKRIGFFEKIYEYFREKEDHCPGAVAVNKGE